MKVRFECNTASFKKALMNYCGIETIGAPDLSRRTKYGGYPDVFASVRYQDADGYVAMLLAALELDHKKSGSCDALIKPLKCLIPPGDSDSKTNITIVLELTKGRLWHFLDPEEARDLRLWFSKSVAKLQEAIASAGI